MHNNTNPAIKPASRIPAIRFKGFSGELEKATLENLSDVRDGTHDSPKYCTKGYPFITSKNVKDGSINYDDVKYIAKNDYDKINRRSKVEINDILMGMIGTIGNIALVREKPNYAIKNVALIKDKDYACYLYIYSHLQSSSIIKQLTVEMDGGTQKFISLSNIRNLSIFFPSSKKEQKQIGVFFQQLDRLITQHQQKHDKLKNVKKALLEKMFPQQGESLPAIRFNGFSDEWEEKPLAEVAQITMGQSPSGENYTNNPQDNILVQGNADMKDGKVVPRIWTTQITKQADAKDLIFSVRAPVGKVGKTDHDVVIGRGVAAIKGNEFVFQLLTKMNDDGYWSMLSAGSTFDSINSSDLSNACMTITNPEEQKQIGVFFQQFDTLINQHQTQITKLEHIKQTCLAKIFV